MWEMEGTNGGKLDSEAPKILRYSIYTHTSIGTSLLRCLIRVFPLLFRRFIQWWTAALPLTLETGWWVWGAVSSPLYPFLDLLAPPPPSLSSTLSFFLALPPSLSRYPPLSVLFAQAVRCVYNTTDTALDIHMGWVIYMYLQSWVRANYFVQ